MEYQAFIEAVKKTVISDFGFYEEGIFYCPEGIVPENKIVRHFVRLVNKESSGEEDDLDLPREDYLFCLDRPDMPMGRVEIISIRQLYQDAQTDGFEKAVARIKEKRNDDFVFRDAFRNRKEYEGVKDTLVIEPRNYWKYAKDLETCLFRLVGDVALVLYQFIGYFDKKKQFTSSKIRLPEIEKWGMLDKREQIFEDALRNTAELFPACVYDFKTGNEVDFLKTENLTLRDIEAPFPLKNVVMLSTMPSVNGAIALFYPGVIEKMMKIMKRPFLAVFMNTTDVMIFERTDMRRALQMTKTAKTDTGMGEPVSGSVYICDEKGVHMLGKDGRPLS